MSGRPNIGQLTHTNFAESEIQHDADESCLGETVTTTADRTP